MRQGIQDSFQGVDEELFFSGCYFLCLLALAEHRTGVEFRDPDIVKAADMARLQGWLGPGCFVEKPGYILHYIGKYPGFPEVAKTDAPPAGGGDYIICSKKPMYAHFTAVIDGRGWDPKMPDRPGAKGYRPDSYRVILGR